MRPRLFVLAVLVVGVLAVVLSVVTMPRDHRHAPYTAGTPTVAPSVPPPGPTPPATARGAYPGTDDTGVPPGTPLRRVAGTVTANRPGQVIDGLDITGKLVVTAPGVVVRDTRITGGSGYPLTVGTGGTVTVTDSEVDGAGRAAVAVCCKRYTLLRVEVRNAVDGLRADGQVTVADSWVHALARTPGSHNDAVQTTKGDGVTLRHNALEPRAGDDPMNSAYIISAGPSGGPVSDVTVTGNWLDGGNYTLYLGDGGAYPVTGVLADGNVFAGAAPRGNARYGPVAALPAGATWTASNVFSTGARVR